MIECRAVGAVSDRHGFGDSGVRVRRRDDKEKARAASPDMCTSRRDPIVAARAAAIADSRAMPVIPEPEPDDPELERTRLVGQGEKLYGKPITVRDGKGFKDRAARSCALSARTEDRGRCRGLRPLDAVARHLPAV